MSALATLFGNPIHDALFVAFCIWNIAHHWIYVFTDVPLSARRMAFNAFFDLLGNGWRHVALTVFFPEQAWLLWLNYAHVAAHAFGLCWFLANADSFEAYGRTFQRREMPRGFYWINWLVEHNDGAFYAVVGVAVAATLPAWALLLIAMFVSPLFVPARAPSQPPAQAAQPAQPAHEPGAEQTLG